MKTPIKKLSSSKLFYNKWPYKVECFVAGSNRIVRNSPDAVEDWCETGNGLWMSKYENNSINKLDLLEFCKKAKSFLKRDDIRIRVEGGHFNLFCLDQVVLDEIDNALSKWIRVIYGPTSKEELDFILSNGHKKRLCEVLPKSKYKFKLYFKTGFPEDKRRSFVSWAKNYGDKIEFSNGSELWLLGTKKYKQDPFMYVEDEKMLSMTGMYLSGYVKKVEEFIERNTVLVA